MKSVKRKVFSIIIIIAFLIGICAAGTVYAMGDNLNHNENGITTTNQDIDESEKITTGISTTNNNITANPGEAENTEVAENSNHDLGLLAAALATGLSCIGAGIAVAMVASSAIGAISENPGLLGKTIIFAGLAEGIAIYGLIISIMILNKI